MAMPKLPFASPGIVAELCAVCTCLIGTNGVLLSSVGTLQPFMCMLFDQSALTSLHALLPW